MKDKQMELAEKIAMYLFTNGAGKQADRLVLTIDGPPCEDLGGLSLRGATHAIAKVLSEPPTP